jgi:hypothetical protein
VHARGAGRDHGLHQLEGVQHAAEPGLGVGHDRGQPVRRAGQVAVLRFGPGDLVGALQGVVDPADDLGHRVDRVQALVRVGLAGQVGVRCHLPAGQVDGLQAGLDLLHGLVAGQRAERRHGIFLGQQLAQPLGAAPGQRELFRDRAAQPHDVLSRVGPLGVVPAGVGIPFVLQAGRLLADALHVGAFLRCVLRFGNSGRYPQRVRRSAAWIGAKVMKNLISLRFGKLY